uniref:Uncharacterized protein n=1 Tax=Equus asinus TaxID=9793 RepID=A0A9L0JD80_EQUAS
MCEIDSLASTFVPNLCGGPKGFPFSLKNFFFRLYEFRVSLNYLYAFIFSNSYDDGLSYFISSDFLLVLEGVFSFLSITFFFL